jgi:hypothetical protein
LAAIQNKMDLMNRTEIRLNSKGRLLIISIFACCSVFSIWGITLPDVGLFYKVGLAIFVLLWLYQSFKWIAEMNDPIIILTKASIQIRQDNKDYFFLWTDIVGYEVDLKQIENITEYTLTLETNTGRSKFKVDGIAKMPGELRQMIDDFRR